MIICLTCCTPNDPGAAACVLCGVELPEQQPLFTEPSGTNIYPEPNPDDMFLPPEDPARGDCRETSVVIVRLEPELAETVHRAATERNGQLAESLGIDLHSMGVSIACTEVRNITEPSNAAALCWDDPTDWIDGQVLPHYTGWYDVQMRSRFNDDHAADGITRFWFAGRDWFTGPNAMDVGAPAVPRGNIFHWRGRAKP